MVALCLYLVLAPFWPKAELALKDDPPLVKDEKIPDQNTLVIPEIKLQETVHEGPDSSTLSKGIWHAPYSSTPPNGGNTVLTGHRFTYAGQDVLYHLDKVAIGDEITVYWDEKRYGYKVDKIEEVKPWQTELVQQTEEPTLTVYTCTPMITATNRLIVQASLMEES